MLLSIYSSSDCFWIDYWTEASFVVSLIIIRRFFIYCNEKEIRCSLIYSILNVICDINNKARTFQLCSKVTTFSGLWIHQGKAKCGEKGQRQPCTAAASQTSRTLSRGENHRATDLAQLPRNNNSSADSPPACRKWWKITGGQTTRPQNTIKRG